MIINRVHWVQKERKEEENLLLVIKLFHEFRSHCPSSTIKCQFHGIYLLINIFHKLNPGKARKRKEKKGKERERSKKKKFRKAVEMNMNAK